MPDLKRHSRDCRICRHRQHETIEREFIDWEPPSRIARSFRIQRSALYRHALALGLVAERQKNIKTCLNHFVERGLRVKPTAATFIQAIIALTKINGDGCTEDRIAFARGAEQFHNFNRGELEDFVRDGVLPERYR